MVFKSAPFAAVLLGWYAFAGPQLARQPSQGPGERRSSPAATVSGIRGDKAVQTLLDRVRGALGGRARLLGVHSLVVEGTITFEGMQPTPFERRFLLPSRFRESRSKVTFTIDDKNYWQDPAPSEEATQTARRSTTATFIEQCLLLLVRAPANYAVEATRQDASSPGVVVVAFTGLDGFARTVEFDATTFMPKAYSSIGTMARGGATTSGTRRVVIDQYQQIAGIQFPRKMTMRQEGLPSAMSIESNKVLVNEGVTVEDYKKR